VDAVRRWGAAALAVLAAAAVAGCGAGSEVRGYLDDTFTEQDSSGDTTTYLAAAAPGPTAAQITGAVPPLAEESDAGSEYLRYDDDVVVVSPAGATSTVRVEDVDDAYCDGAYAYLGPGFTPGSPAAASCSDDAK
jgi:hypothetical protein